jgi:hypothetical protein
MYETVNLFGFINAFKKVRPNNFTLEALELIYEFLTTYEDDTNIEVELDVIAICCDFTEMKQNEVLESYPILSKNENGIIDFLTEKTLFLGITSDKNYVFQSF